LTPTVTPTGYRSAVDERLLWAARRLSELRKAADDYLTTAFKVREDLVAATAVARLTISDLPPSELGSMAGDVIHNLRACLDNLIWEITPTAARSRRTAFPIRSTEAGFASAVTENLSGLPAAVVDAARNVQPFVPERLGGLANNGGELLKLLDDFWNDDKHRVPTVALATLSVVPPSTFRGTLASMSRLPGAKREVQFRLQREDQSVTVDLLAQMHIVVNDVIKRVRAAC
jgi:hypothetical protein